MLHEYHESSHYFKRNCFMKRLSYLPAFHHTSCVSQSALPSAAALSLAVCSPGTAGQTSLSPTEHWPPWLLCISSQLQPDRPALVYAPKTQPRSKRGLNFSACCSHLQLTSWVMKMCIKQTQIRYIESASESNFFCFTMALFGWTLTCKFMSLGLVSEYKNV